MRQIVFVALILISALSQADVCPDPETSSLSWGEPPTPWVENPYSKNRPQGESNTRFVKANILLAGTSTRGISCTYKNSIGNYSIWWPVRVKKPSPLDVRWLEQAYGYGCSESISSCKFHVSIV